LRIGGRLYRMHGFGEPSRLSVRPMKMPAILAGEQQIITALAFALAG
jgi:hypothetical protein